MATSLLIWLVVVGSLWNLDGMGFKGHGSQKGSSILLLFMGHGHGHCYQFKK